MSTFLPIGGFKWTDSKLFNLNKDISNSSKDMLFNLTLNIQKNHGIYIMIIF